MQGKFIITSLERNAISVTQPSAQSLDVFKYTIPLSLSNLNRGRYSYKNWLSGIITNILRGINKHHLITLQLYPGLFELYNVRYAEKWVKRIDENFLEYHAGSKLSLNIPPYPLPRNLKYLSTKSFSGDVSGTIAESLFIYFLHNIGIDINLVGHLRPYKKLQGQFAPDFVIWDNGMLNIKIADMPLISMNNCKLPIYAEVKGSTSQINEKQIEKALLQLNQVIREPQDCGLIFVAYKNPNYEGIVFEVQL
jgi:hypothetical protein